MAVDPAISKWRAEGRHLPAPLRDFHDQKDVFRLVHDLTRPPADPLFKHPSWVDGQVYVIDTFLWCMARHGYTLQRSRARLPFDDLSDNIKAMRERESAAMTSILGD